jgi:hypothetical protein
MNMPSTVIAVALMAAAAPWLGSPAAALPISSPLALQSAVPSSFETVRNRGRGYIGAGVGIAAGAIIGGAILNATQPRGYYGNGYYGNGGYGYSGYDNGYNAYGYGQGYGGYEPEYVEAPSYGYAPGPAYRQGTVAAGSDPAYCQQRYRSYDRASGTYLGHDGLRHPC